MTLRQQLRDELTRAMKSREQRSVAILRLILAAVKDQDIAARDLSDDDASDDRAILKILDKMARQTRESITAYRAAGREDLWHQEQEDLAIITQFLPQPLSEEETVAAVREAIAVMAAQSITDLGKVMKHLKQQHAGQMDFRQAGALARKQLG